MPDVIAWVGVVTALFAATIAVAQNDIKKVLAYSTVSQLGYMFLAVGTGAYVAAIFHMVTHAFFKALLFLGSGSVIHGMHDEQDMRRMGGLRKFMPVTAATFIVGWLAIAGVPPFAGFWSKDEILLFAWDDNPALWAVGLVTALLTAFYMSRQVFMVFFGDERWHEKQEKNGDDHGADHSHAADRTSRRGRCRARSSCSPVLAVVGGALNLPFTDDTKFLEHWLEPVLGEHEAHLAASHGHEVALAVVAIVAAAAGIASPSRVYLAAPAPRRSSPSCWPGLVLRRGPRRLRRRPGPRRVRGRRRVRRKVVDGAVNGVGAARAHDRLRLRVGPDRLRPQLRPRHRRRRRSCSSGCFLLGRAGDLDARLHATSPHRSTAAADRRSSPAASSAPSPSPSCRGRRPELTSSSRCWRRCSPVP